MMCIMDIVFYGGRLPKSRPRKVHIKRSLMKKGLTLNKKKGKQWQTQN